MDRRRFPNVVGESLGTDSPYTIECLQSFVALRSTATQRTSTKWLANVPTHVSRSTGVRQFNVHVKVKVSFVIADASASFVEGQHTLRQTLHSVQ
jgi:hypothetical protein